MKSSDNSKNKKPIDTAKVEDNEKLTKLLHRLYPQGDPGFVDLTLHELHLHGLKNQDYAGAGDPLGNFFRASRMLENYPHLSLTDPLVVCLVYMLKQLDTVLWAQSCRYQLQTESMHERLQDISVYTKLAMLILCRKPFHLHALPDADKAKEK